MARSIAKYRVSKKTWTYFENTITPSFMEEFFSKLSVLVANCTSFVEVKFYYHIALLTGSGVIML